LISDLYPNNMKVLLLLITLITTLNTFSQSKKDQIEVLNLQLDSIKQVLILERTSALKNSASKDSVISSINSQIENQNDVISNLNSELSTVIRELDKTEEQTRSLQKLIALKSDSLKLLMSKKDNTDLDVELSYSALNKPAVASMKEIGDWLSQFNEASATSVTFIDEKTAKFYGGDEALLEVHGKVTLQNSVYKEGIIFSHRAEFEGSLYQLFIPLLKLSDVKRNIERLCKNMGGCLQPEEMEIKYEETDFGIKITWGGGC